jgi:hypothetical protein
VGNYDEMSTARLTWVVLDRLVPTDEVAEARAALIARDPELRSLVAQGVMSETEALHALQSRQSRYGGAGPTLGSGRPVLWMKRLAALAGTGLVTTTVLHFVR